MSKRPVLKSIVFLTLMGTITKGAEFMLGVFYSRTLGGEGMGVMSLTMSVFSIVLSFATAGVQMAVSKLVGEQCEMNKENIAHKTVQTALFCVSAVSLCAIALGLIFADDVAGTILREPRTRLAVCCMLPSILFMGISYCLKGYFYGIRRTKIIIASEILELMIKTAAVITLVNKLLPLGIEWGCAAVAIGLCIGEFCSCMFLCMNSKDVIFKADDKSKAYPVMPIIKICLPVIIGACLSRILRMQEEVFMVSSLSKFGLSNSSALENLGVLQGMIMPVLIFPITLTGALVTTIIPEISRAQASQNSARMKSLIFKLYGFAVIMGICTTALLMLFSDTIAFNIYNNPIVAEMVCKMAFLVPIMLLDSISCAVLNGLGKQTGLLFIGLGDSFLRLAIVYFLVPYMGMAAVYGMIILSNLFTCLLSMARVLNLTRNRKNVIIHAQ